MSISFEQLIDYLDRMLELGAEHQIQPTDLSLGRVDASSLYTKLCLVLDLELETQLKKYQDKLQELRSK